MELVVVARPTVRILSYSYSMLLHTVRTHEPMVLEAWWTCDFSCARRAWPRVDKKDPFSKAALKEESISK